MTPQEERKQTELELVDLLAWAKQRDNTATLDSTIKRLIVKKIGTLTADQALALKMQQTLIPFGVTPTFFVDQRADKMYLTDEERDELGAPDLSDAAETDMRVWALTDICNWLEAQPDGRQRYVDILKVYQAAITDAANVYGHAYVPPIAVKAINMVMTLARARKYLKAAEKGK